MKLLAIDTTEDACSAALLVDGGVDERFELAPRRHSELILPMMDVLLTEAGLGLRDLDALAFARGPGAFTGLRIAASIVQGAALGADLPVVPVSSLQALAQGAWREQARGASLCAFDARMGEVYWGAFRVEQGVARAVGEEHVSAPDRVELPAGADWSGAGSGWAAYPDMVGAGLAGAPPALAGLMVHAADVAVLAEQLFAAGHAVAPGEALPVYLRDQVAWARS